MTTFCFVKMMKFAIPCGFHKCCCISLSTSNNNSYCHGAYDAKGVFSTASSSSKYLSSYCSRPRPTTTRPRHRPRPTQRASMIGYCTSMIGLATQQGGRLAIVDNKLRSHLGTLRLNISGNSIRCLNSGLSVGYIMYESKCKVLSKKNSNPNHNFKRNFIATDETNPPTSSPVLLECLEDKIFDIVCQEDNTLLVGDFITILQSRGLQLEDPRLHESISKFQQIVKSKNLHFDNCYIDKETFKNCITDNIVLIERAFTNKFIIPDFEHFCNHLEQLYNDVKGNSSGMVATYIPQLSRQDPAHWGVSVCTIDGQRYSIGDTKEPFCLQSCCKAPAYALTVTAKGSDFVHQYVGFEPSGKPFNELALNSKHKPHNPLLNSGGILIASLLKSDWSPADSFDFTSKQFKRLTGGELVGFSNATFLSEKETAFRNRAIAYLMKEYNCFPENSNIDEVLDLYFQLCSIEVSCESGSVIAATLANGGVCPITGDRVLNPAAVRDTLTIMSSCGMYDYSGQFAFQIGLPAKSGVAGGILVVVPNIMGMMIWSPPLDSYGNSVRGLHFLKDLVSINSFHNFDNLRHTTKKMDPRKSKVGSSGTRIVNLLFGAYNNDLSAMRQYALQEINMEQADYDLRTALHVAAAEGHVEIVEFLLAKCKVNPSPKDRWGFTPLHEARQFDHKEVASILEQFCDE